MKIEGLKIRVQKFSARWVSSEEAMAAVEAALIFPILMTLLLGVFDMGNGILANQKAIRASQIVADLITRERTVNDASIEEAIEAGRLAFETLSSETYGVDIISMRFDNDAEAEIVWRETRDMSPVDDPLGRVESIAERNSGVVMVAVRYNFEPLFSGFVVNEIPMQEVAFARGRETPVVNRN